MTTADAGSEASVSNSGNDKDAVLDITIPRGENGASFHMAGPWEPGTDYVNDTKQIDIVTHEGSSYGCRKSHTSAEGLAPENDPECWQCVAEKGNPGSVENIGSVNIPFTPPEERGNISPEDTLGVILGKLEKIVTDLKDVAFSRKYSDLSGTLEKVSELENDAGYVTTDTWKANTATSEGYVSAGKENPNNVWGTDEEGNPGWKPAINPDDLKYDTMTGATAEEPGIAGMVPAPEAGKQDAFLQGCGIWKNLGAAAFYNVANTDDITEENFLVDGRRFKALRDNVDEIMSTLESLGGGEPKVENFSPYIINPGDSDMLGIAYKINKVVFFTINGVPKYNSTAEAYVRGLPYMPNSNYLGTYWSSGVQCSLCTIISNGSIVFRKNDTITLKYSDIVNKVLFISGWYLTN